MIDRRRWISSTLAAATAALPALRAHAKGFPGDVDPRGTIGRLERLPRLDLEAREDLSTDFRIWVTNDLRRQSRVRAEAILKANGLPSDTDLPLDQAMSLFQNDPIIAAGNHTWKNCQSLMWQELHAECHGNGDRLMSEMESADTSGPGSLELNPKMFIPDYAKHEIHMQPGGYVGDPFAGHIYHYGTNNFYMARNNQDEIHFGYAQATPRPADGRVRRILDLGVSCGQLTVALKQRFPDAEVWGLDVGGPMVRYAHMRAVDLGVDVNFAQRLAEDTKFPDNHFDIVTSYILFHEVSRPACSEIMKEINRVLRPGGVFFPMEVKMVRPEAKRTAFGRFMNWFTQNGINERWYMDYMDTDYTAEIRAAGMVASDQGPAAERYAKFNVLGTKPT
jgi:ubiquinone/menaquinone biosynthesis C-methylase UbiE